MDSNLAEKISKESADRLWFVARGSVLKGPFSTDQLREKVSKKEISFMDFCWRHGFNEWRPIGSVDDFDRRNRLKSLPQYPSVEVPATMTGGIYLKDTSPPEEEAPPPANDKLRKKAIAVGNLVPPQPRTRFEVSFSKQPRYSISIYEWGLAVILGVVMAYFAADYAMKEVARSVTAHMAKLVAGVEQNVGQQPLVQEEVPGNGKSVNPEMWMPLYSAPSFAETFPAPHEPSLDLDAPLRLDVQVSGQLTGKPGQWAIGPYAVEINGNPDLWSPAEEGIDPVYLRPLRAHGQLSKTDALKLQVHLKGEPVIFAPYRAFR